MLRLKCRADVVTTVRSRVAVLNTDSVEFDYGLVTGHGVPPDRPCNVLDFNGRRVPVESITFAADYVVGSQTDWALIKFAKISTPGLVRYDIEPVSATTPIDNMRVNFARARGFPENFQDCRLEILNFSGKERRVSHDCKSIPGQSGTPVTRKIEQRDMLVGLHIGQLWMLESPKTGKPDRKGYINLFDLETVDEILSIIDEKS